MCFDYNMQRTRIMKDVQLQSSSRLINNKTFIVVGFITF